LTQTAANNGFTIPTNPTGPRNADGSLPAIR